MILVEQSPNTTTLLHRVLLASHSKSQNIGMKISSLLSLSDHPYWSLPVKQAVCIYFLIISFFSYLLPSSPKKAGIGTALLVNLKPLFRNRLISCLETFLCPLPLPSGHFTVPVHPIKKVDRGNEKI